MFGIFKKDKTSPAKKVESIADELFAQIKQARDEAKEGGVLTEKVFNDRLNSMFVAGYLVGYVDEYIAALFESDEDKKENAERIFETMFPGVGSDFVKAKLIERQKANTIAESSSNYPAAVERAKRFDTGMDFAQEEVEEIKKNSVYQPVRLKKYLLLGEI